MDQLHEMIMKTTNYVLASFVRFYIGILLVARVLFTNIVVFIIHLVKNFFFPTTKELIKTTIFPDIYVSTWEEGVGDLTIVLVT